MFSCMARFQPRLNTSDAGPADERHDEQRQQPWLGAEHDERRTEQRDAEHPQQQRPLEPDGAA